MTAHDMHDCDGVNENVLLDLNISGRTRKVLAHPDRNARLCIIDRVTGEMISAEAFGNQNTSEGVNLKTGRLKIVPAKSTGCKTVRDSCPASPGAKNWQPSSSSPRSGVIYTPHNKLCMEYQGMQANCGSCHTIAGIPQRADYVY